MRTLQILFLLCVTVHAIAQPPAGLSPDDFEKAIASPRIQVLDVRTAEEYGKEHLANSLLADWTNRKQFEERTAALDKMMPVYTYCLSGGRSSEAAGWLRSRGFTVYTLTGGMFAWNKADKPVEGMKQVRQITMAEYLSKIGADKPVLVDVGATWCPPCRKMKPVIDSLQEAGKEEFRLLEIDGGDQVSLVKQLGIENFPTFIIYKNGKEVWRKQGLVDAGEIARRLRS